MGTFTFTYMLDLRAFLLPSDENPHTCCKYVFLFIVLNMLYLLHEGPPHTPKKYSLTKSITKSDGAIIYGLYEIHAPIFCGLRFATDRIGSDRIGSDRNSSYTFGFTSLYVVECFNDEFLIDAT